MLCTKIVFLFLFWHSKQYLCTTCCKFVFWGEFDEQSLVILWVNWFKNESFSKKFTCMYLCFIVDVRRTSDAGAATAAELWFSDWDYRKQSFCGGEQVYIPRLLLLIGGLMISFFWGGGAWIFRGWVVVCFVCFDLV